MSDPDMANRGWRGWLAGPALFLGLVSLLALGAAPLAWREGWLRLGSSFGLLAVAALAAVLGALLAIMAFIFAGRSFGLWRIVLLIGVLLLGAGYILLPVRLWMRHAPAIHDISTDTADPPALIAPLAARAAEHGASAAYGGPAIAAQQQKAYPEIAPLTLPLSSAKAFDLALATARSMPRWTVTASDPASGRIEASQASFWFGFVDDIVIRVTPAGEGSRIDIRSVSRQGKGDLGVNADRVRAYLTALKAAAAG
jgi:uncharacterized protein (DUF1499 family)